MRLPFTWLLLLVIPFSGVGYSGDIATERTQAANGGILLVIQRINDAIQLASEHIQNLEELAALAHDPLLLAENIPGAADVIDRLKEMEEIIRQGEAVVHSTRQLERVMKDKFKTYEEYFEIIADADGDGIGRRRIDFDNRFKMWSETHNQTIRNILQSHAIQAEQFDSELERFEKYREMSRSTEGRMQALQIGNEIATEEILQLTKLREIVMEQTDLHANYFAIKRAMESEQRAFEEWSHETLLGRDLTNGQFYGP